MDKRIVIFFVGLVVAGFFFLHPAAESFYLKALQDGKTSYRESRFEQAINEFKIAEFGLFGEKEYLGELYLYYALSCYKLGRVTESSRLLDELKTELNIKELKNLTAPLPIENDVKVMISALEKYDNQTGGAAEAKTLAQIDRFESGFLKAYDLLKNDHLAGVEKEIKGLTHINKKDARISFLKGAAAFKKKKYDKCIGYLKGITKAIDPLYRDEIFYYLSLSYYFKEKGKEAHSYYKMIGDKALREKLDKIIHSNAE